MKFRKKIQKRRLSILKISQDNPQNNFFEFFDFIKTLKLKIYKLKCFQKNKKWGGELNNCRSYEEG